MKIEDHDLAARIATRWNLALVAHARLFSAWYNLKENSHTDLGNHNNRPQRQWFIDFDSYFFRCCVIKIYFFKCIPFFFCVLPCSVPSCCGCSRCCYVYVYQTELEALREQLFQHPSFSHVGTSTRGSSYFFPNHFFVVSVSPLVAHQLVSLLIIIHSKERNAARGILNAIHLFIQNQGSKNQIKGVIN